MSSVELYAVGRLCCDLHDSVFTSESLSEKSGNYLTTLWNFPFIIFLSDVIYDIDQTSIAPRPLTDRPTPLGQLFSMENKLKLLCFLNSIDILPPVLMRKL